MQRPLTPLDLGMLGMDDASRRMGDAGFETLTLLRFDGQLDPHAFDAALSEVVRRHPWLAGRLSRNWLGTRIWRWEADSRLAVETRPLVDSDPETLHAATEALLSEPRDLSREAGLTFVRLADPDGRDCLALRANHALVDHPSAMLILETLSRLLNGEPLPPAVGFRDLSAEFRNRYSRAQRNEARRTLLGQRRKKSVRTRPRRLSEIAPTTRAAPRPHAVRVATRRWDAATADRFARCLSRISRLPSESMAILAAALRVVSDMVPDPQGEDLLRTHLGVDLGMTRLDGFVPQNASSILRIQAVRRELLDRRGRVTQFVDQLLETLRIRRELGMLEMMTRLRRIFPAIRAYCRRFMERSFSLFYAYFVVPEEIQTRFGPLRVREIRYLPPTWSPMGLTLLAARERGSVQFQASYLPHLVPSAVAEEFLDRLLGELEATMREVEDTPAAAGE